MATNKPDGKPDKREIARDVNKPVAPRQPFTAPGKAKDKHHIDSQRGRGPATKMGSAPRRGGQRGR